MAILVALVAFGMPAGRQAEVTQLRLLDEAFLPWKGEVRVQPTGDTRPFRPTDAFTWQREALFLDGGSGRLVNLGPDGSPSYFDLATPSPTEASPEFSHLAGTQTGTLLITDRANSQIWNYSPEGRFLGPFLSQEAKRAAGLSTPTAILQDGQGRVLVADAGDQSIKVFNKVGELLSSWGGAGAGPGEFSYPTDMLEDMSGNLVVADSNNRRIQIFDSSHRFIRAFSQTKGSMALGLPRSLALDGRGRLHVADSFGERVSVFTPEGEFLGSYGFTGPTEQRLVLPEGLALLGERAVVGDRGNQRLAIYGK
jgi:hypothetical protein